MKLNDMITELKELKSVNISTDGKAGNFRTFHNLFMKAANVYAEYKGVGLTDGMQYVMQQIEG